MKHISLYIHIPFCVRKCLYCDFTSFPDKTDRIEDYLHRLECEMDEAVSRFGDLTVDTLFLGGGTPSLLGGDDMKRLMDAAAKRFSIAPGAEITCEYQYGISNEVLPGKTAEVSVQTGRLLLVKVY